MGEPAVGADGVELVKGRARGGPGPWVMRTGFKVNAVKNAVSGMANALAAVCFALFGDVRWAFVAPLAAGFLVGGWIGPKIGRKVPAGPFRVIVSPCGIGLAVKLGMSAYR